VADTSRIAIDLLRSDTAVSWVADHLLASYAEGIAQSAKELVLTDQASYALAHDTTARREKVKREKYETSRPYSESERVALLEFALEQVFITLPAIQTSVAKALTDLGAKANTIEFSAPDEEERETHSYILQLSARDANSADLRARLERFRTELHR